MACVFRDPSCNCLIFGAFIEKPQKKYSWVYTSRMLIYISDYKFF